MDPMTATLPEEEFAALVERTELARCPLCGSNISLTVGYAYGGYGTANVKCFKCGLTLPRSEVRAKASKNGSATSAAEARAKAEAKKQCIERWNTRPVEDSLRAQLALDTDTINAVREAAKAVTGGNCDFADDDVERLRALAMEAEGLRAERDALRAALGPIAAKALSPAQATILVRASEAGGNGPYNHSPSAHTLVKLGLLEAPGRWSSGDTSGAGGYTVTDAGNAVADSLQALAGKGGES